MSDESIGDESSSTSRRTHSAKHHQIFKIHVHKCFAVKPALVVHELSNKLERWLGTICLLFGHVQIIDKYNAFFTNRRTIVTFSSFLHLTVYSILGLIGTCLG